jgi:hypothetical protein
VSGDLIAHINEPRCIRTFTRSASGRLSSARELCGSDLPSRALKEREITQITGNETCENGTLTGVPSSRPRLAWLAVLAPAVLGARRRTRKFERARATLPKMHG